MTSGGYEVDVGGEGSTLKYMNNESHALYREERNPHHCFASKFPSTWLPFLAGYGSPAFSEHVLFMFTLTSQGALLPSMQHKSQDQVGI